MRKKRDVFYEIENVEMAVFMNTQIEFIVQKI
jgi:hypothetical protein